MTNAEKAIALHEEWNGKFETTPKMTIATRQDLALAYTPGVAEPCKIIAQDKSAAYKYTIKSNPLAASMLYQFVLTHKTQKKLSKPLYILHLLLAELIWKIYLHQDVLKLKNV